MEELTLLKCLYYLEQSTLPTPIYRINVSSINISMTLFTEIENKTKQQQQKKTPIYIEPQKTLSQNNPEKKEQS